MPEAPPLTAKFTQGSILRHVVTMALTGTLGLLAIFAVDLANLFYISLLGVQELAAAVGFAGTVLFLQTALCIGLTIGLGATVARAIGAGRRDEACRLAGSGLAALVAIAAAVGLLALPLLDPMLSALGAEGETKRLALGYLTIVSPSLPLLGAAMGLSALLRAVGDARRGMNVTLYGALVTLVLDPLLILALHLDLTGAAIATLASRTTMLAFGWHGAVRVHRIVGRPRAGQLWPDLRPLFAIAGPAVLTNLATPVASAYVTGALARFGDAAVAGQAIVDRLVPVVFAAIFALTGAVGPIFAQNLGAGRGDRLLETLRASLQLVLACVALAWLLLFLGQDLLIALFSARGITADLVRLFCTGLAGTFLFLGCLFVANSAFNNLGFPWLSTLFNWGRATLGTIPLAALGAELDGARGVLLGQTAGIVLFGTAALLTAFRVVGRLGTRLEMRTGAPAAAPSYWRPPLSPAASGKASIATLAVSEEPAPAEDRPG